MWTIGFGLEHIGLAAVRRPVLFSLLLVAVSTLAVLQLPSVRFDGDVTSVLPEETKAYADFFEQKRAFRDSARDVTILVRSDRVTRASGLEDLRSLHLDLALADPVEDVLSLFSIPDPDPQSGELRQFFPRHIDSDAEAERLVAALLERFPQASRLIAPDRHTAVLVVTLATSVLDGEETSYRNFRRLKEQVSEMAPPDFEVLYTGITPIGATIVGALISDQLKLTSIGLALGTAIALYIFRSFLAAMICAVPPTLTALWSIGVFGAAGTPITYLTTVLPTLALILAFADGIVLYFRWQTANAGSDDLAGNLEEAIRRVGPASALTSITTLLAFLSFSFAAGSALKEFSALGMVVVAIAFLSMITGLPLAAHWAIATGLARPGRARLPAFSGFGEPIQRLVARLARPIALAAIGLVLVLGYVHTLIMPEFRITDYLPMASETRRAEQLTNEVIGGRSPIFATVPKAADGSPFHPENRERLQQMGELLADAFDTSAIFSANRLADSMTDEAALTRLEAQLGQASEGSRTAFESKDGTQMLVTLYIPSNQPIATTLSQLDAARSSIARLDWGGDVILTGFDVLMADEFTRLIEQLRSSLLIAILLGIGIIGVATRSPLLAVAAITPNLLPIFAIEGVIMLKGGTVNLSEVIALTISFGIAIDNAVHVINVYNRQLAAGRHRPEAIAEAVREVGPALAASTAIICMSCLVTQLSILPMVPVLGRLMIATLLIAYVSNLFILPANILTLGWTRRGGEASAAARRSAAGD